VPSARMRSSSARSPLVSEAFIPPRAPSRASRTGSVARARAIQAPLIAVRKLRPDRSPGRGCRRSRAAPPRAARFPLPRRASPIAQHRAEDARARAGMAADHDVFEGDRLRRAGCSGRCGRCPRRDPVGLEPGEIPSVEEKAAAVSRVEPGEQVEQRGLSGAVRAYHPKICPREIEKLTSMSALDAAEALAYAFGLKQHAHGLRSASSRLRTVDGHKRRAAGS